MLGASSQQRVLGGIIGVLAGVLMALLLVPATSVISTLERDSMQDSLTELANRREILRRGEVLEASGVGYAVAVVDVDLFKAVNDAHGHHVGDQVLRALSAHLLATDGDVGRLGGEEFAILFRTAQQGDYFERLEDLRKTLETTDISTAVGPVAVTVSIGVDEPTLTGASFAESLRRADDALMLGKRSGRNVTVRSNPRTLSLIHI